MGLLPPAHLYCILSWSYLYRNGSVLLFRIMQYHWRMWGGLLCSEWEEVFYATAIATILFLSILQFPTIQKTIISIYEDHKQSVVRNFIQRSCLWIHIIHRLLYVNYTVKIIITKRKNRTSCNCINHYSVKIWSHIMVTRGLRTECFKKP